MEGADEAIEHLARLARELGLKQMVLLSGRGEPGAQRAEAALRGSGLPWSIVRASWFNQNFSEGYLLGSILDGELALPAGPAPFDSPAAKAYADIVAQRRTAGRPIAEADCQIAAIALALGAPVATRNVKDFDGCGVRVINPWNEQ